MNFWPFRSSTQVNARSRNQPARAAGRGRRPDARLELEALEDRALPSATVISGFVYHDANNNGLYEPAAGETPYANTRIQLLNSAGAVVGDTTTDANGYYQFAADQTISTAPLTKTYTATFPSTLTNYSLTRAVQQFDPSLGTLLSVSIVNSGSITSDIKVENTSDSSGTSITGTVGGTMTLTGPGVNLTTSPQRNTGTFTATAFDGTIDFTGSSGTDFGPRTASGTNSGVLTGSAMNPFIGSGAVSLRESATATSTASGGGNVLVGITSRAAATVTVTYKYIPNNSIRSGNYTIVEITQPPGTSDGKVSRNGTVLNNPPGQDIIPITVTGPNLPNNDFGKLLPASLSGYVYGDISPGGYNNGIKDAGEPGIPNTTVTLVYYGPGPAVAVSTTTDANGYYHFDNLLAGSFSILETQPAGWLDGKDTIGSQSGTPMNDRFDLTLSQGVNGVNNNFGELLPSSLSGYVYVDTSATGFNDGIKEPGEPGIPNTPVTLTGTSDRGAVNIPTATDGNGFYHFDNLRPGTYAITETQPGGYIDGKDTIGSQGGTTGNDVFYNIALAPNVQGVNNNFGELTPVVSPPPLPPPGPPPAADLQIVKTASAATVEVNTAVSYTLTVSNLGPNTATGVTVRDNLPGGVTFVSAGGAGWTSSQGGGIVTFTTGSLASGASSVLTVTILAPSTAGNILNISTVTSNTPDTNPNNNTSQVTVAVIAPPPTGISQQVFAPTPAAFPGPGDITVVGKTSLFNDSSNSANDPVLMGQIAYVDTLYRTLLGRPSDTAGLVYWVQQLRAGMPRAVVVQAFWTSAAHRDQQIETLYRTYLGRDAGAGDFNYWNSVFAAGASENAVAAMIVASPEYAASHPDAASFIDSLYRSALGRPADPAGLNYWESVLAGNSRQAVAGAILGSDEASLRMVSLAYGNFLGRSPGSADQQWWLAQLHSGVTQSQICVLILNSDEFYNRAAQAAQA